MGAHFFGLFSPTPSGASPVQGVFVMVFPRKLAFVVLLVLLPLGQNLASGEIRAEKKGANSQPAETLTFSRKNPLVGDIAKQDLQMRMQLQIEQGTKDKPGSTIKINVENIQQRTIEVLDVRDNRPREVKVDYTISQSKRGEVGVPVHPKRFPVHGKTYRVARVGEKLVITDPEGNTPSTEEVAYIARSMEMLGRENPLANFLAGKKLRKGESIDLPAEVAKNLFGLDKALGEDVALRLTLNNILQLDGRICGVFKATLMFKIRDSEPLGLRVEGQLWIEPTSCRPVAAHLLGPISMRIAAETGQEAIKAFGSIQVAIRAEHSDATEHALAAKQKNKQNRVR